METKKALKSQEELDVAAIRALVIDTINKAKSGHPGMALDAAPALYALFRDHLVADPMNPEWFNRDRFVLSSGHASALLYSMLHVAGYEVSMDDLKSFRQYGSKTPGHPEYGHTKGVDATSGPLGQGIAQAVGMAIAERAVASQYKEGATLCSHYTYCLCGDGCLEEGLSQEAISLAGHYHLNKLILIYDENGSTLDGPTSDSLSENVKLRFYASGWDVIEVKDGNNVAKVSKAIEKAKQSVGFPTLIMMHTKIGYGSKNAGLSKTHGEPLGEEDGAYAKAQYGYDYPLFTVPESVYVSLRNAFASRGIQAHAAYEEGCKKYAVDHPEDYQRFLDAIGGKTEGYLPKRPEFVPGSAEASRVSSGKYVTALNHAMPFAMGGSADVAGSTKTNVSGEPIFSPEHPEGRDVHWGIREFAMASAINGMLLHKGLVGYAACFLIFSDYMKSAIRMACLEHLPALYLFTHDSLAVGEDGPTHEPIEQLAALRSIPGMDVLRPADARETVGCYEAALTRKDGPSALILTRQNLPLLEGSSADEVRKGGYIVYKPSKDANLQIVATGSEVSLGIEASKLLEEAGVYAEVVSIPSWKRFEEMGKEYKASILHLPYSQRVSIEMASPLGWAKYAEHNIGIETFGASGPAKALMEAYGFTPSQIKDKILAMVKGE